MFNKIKSTPQKIESEYELGNFYKVSKLCKEIGEHNINPAFLNYKACAFYKTGLFLRSVEIFTQLISLEPNASYAFFNRGCAYDELKDYSKAIKDYNKAMFYDLNDPDIYSNRAVTKFKMGDTKGCLKDLDKAINLNSKDPVYYYNRFMVFEKQGRLEEAIESLTMASKLGFSKAKTRLNIIAS